MRAIFKREVMSYMRSISGWLFIALNLLFMNLYLTVYNLYFGYPYFSYALQSADFIFIIAMPLITMRSFAEERKNKTDQLIITAPVSVRAFVMGKFFAMECMFIIPCLFACLMPLLLSLFGSVPYAETYVAVLGYFLYGSASIALGLLISAMTENVIIAAVLSVILLFAGYIMAGIGNLFAANAPWLSKVLSYYDLLTPFTEMSAGKLPASSLVYYVSFILLMLFLTMYVLDHRKYQGLDAFSKKSLMRSAAFLGSIVIFVCVNFGVRMLPEDYAGVDVTGAGVYSITEETEKFLDTLSDNIRIYVMAPEATMDRTVKETLAQYASYNGKIEVTYVDPAKNPTFVQQYTDENVSGGSLIVTLSDQDNMFRIVPYDNMYVTEMNYETYQQETTGYDAEGQITSAIAYVTGAEVPKMYLISGHGEIALGSAFEQSVSKLNMEMETLNLLSVPEIPSDAAVLVVNGPENDFSADDTAKIQKYLEQGGDAIFLYGYSEKEQTNYLKLLSDCGITIETGLIFERSQSNFYQNPLYLLPLSGRSGITGNLTNFVFMPYAAGIRVEEKENVTYLLGTSEQAFLRRHPESETSIDMQEGDAAGPFALGAEAVKKVASSEAGGTAGESRVIVYPSAVLFTDTANEMVAGQNVTLFLNSLRDVTGQNAANSSAQSGLEGAGAERADSSNGVPVIPVKEYEMHLLVLSTANMILVGLPLTVLLPIAILIPGILFWAMRRKL